MTAREIQGPVRVVEVANIPFEFLIVDKMGHFICSGAEWALTKLAAAWNEANPSTDKSEPVKVNACPECGWPKQTEEQGKCWRCLAPPLLTEEQEVKQKEAEQSEWF